MLKNERGVLECNALCKASLSRQYNVVLLFDLFVLSVCVVIIIRSSS